LFRQARKIFPHAEEMNFLAGGNISPTYFFFPPARKILPLTGKSFQRQCLRKNYQGACSSELNLPFAMSPDVSLQQTFARYNSWMNERLLASCSVLRDDARRKPLSVPFGSLHGLWNHLLIADNLWMSRFENTPLPFEFRGLDMELCADWNDLREQRRVLDERISRFAQGLNEQRLGSILQWIPATNPTPRELPFSLVLAHFWNHQTHHRGQITGVMELLGLDCGVTDLLALPDLKEG